MYKAFINDLTAINDGQKDPGISQNKSGVIKIELPDRWKMTKNDTMPEIKKEPPTHRKLLFMLFAPKANMHNKKITGANHT